jgi:hypothetical protein
MHPWGGYGGRVRPLVSGDGLSPTLILSPSRSDPGFQFKIQEESWWGYGWAVQGVNNHHYWRALHMGFPKPTHLTRVPPRSRNNWWQAQFEQVDEEI